MKVARLQGSKLVENFSQSYFSALTVGKHACFQLVKVKATLIFLVSFPQTPDILTLDGVVYNYSFT